MSSSPLSSFSCLLCGLLALLWTCAAHAAPTYSITALPAGSVAAGINARGQIVGSTHSYAGQAFLWTGGITQNLGTLGGVYSMGLALNDRGEVTGWSETAGGTQHAFKYSKGSMVDLDRLGGEISYGSGINNSGQVAGGIYLGGIGHRAFVTHVLAGDANSVPEILGTLGGVASYASGINQAGQITGTSGTDPFGFHDDAAFLYSGGVMHRIGEPDEGELYGVAINDHGQVVGLSGDSKAFLYSDGVLTSLGGLPGLQTHANALNNLGQVVGALTEPFTPVSAFLYERGVITDLNTLIDPALGYTILDATGINDLGQIVAYGCRAEACGALLLSLSPVPEPFSWALLLAGLLLYAGRPGALSRRCIAVNLIRWRAPDLAQGA